MIAVLIVAAFIAGWRVLYLIQERTVLGESFPCENPMRSCPNAATWLLVQGCRCKDRGACDPCRGRAGFTDRCIGDASVVLECLTCGETHSGDQMRWVKIR